jgi:hypothetical protein
VEDEMSRECSKKGEKEHCITGGLRRAELHEVK